MAGQLAKDLALKQGTKRERNALGTPSENATPRTLIQGLLGAASVSKSAAHLSQAKKPRLTKSPQVPPPKKRRRSLRKSIGENTTPRTLIRNYLNEASPETPLEIPQQAQFAEEENKLSPNLPTNQAESTNFHSSNLHKLSPLEPASQSKLHQDISVDHEAVPDNQSSPESSLSGSNDKNGIDEDLIEENTEISNSLEQESVDHNTSSQTQDVSPEINQDLPSSSESASKENDGGDGEISEELSESPTSQNQEPNDLNTSQQDTIPETIPVGYSSSDSTGIENDEGNKLSDHNDNAIEMSDGVAMVTDTLMTEESQNSKWKNLMTPHFPVTKRRVLAEMTSDTNDSDEGSVHVAELKEGKGKHSVIKRKQSSKVSAPFPRKYSSDTNLPSSLVKSIFQHFSKRKVTKETLEIIQKGSSLFFKNISSDLMAYCQHAGRSTIDIGDVELLMKRQGFVTTKQSLYSLIEKYLPLEYRQELIPVAQSGNKILVKRS